MGSRLITQDDLTVAGEQGLNDQWAALRGVLLSTIVSAKATEALAAGDFVNIYDNAGVVSVRRAIATAYATAANGFVRSDVTSGASGLINLAGMNDKIVIAATLQDCYLSDATAGKVISSAPTTAGRIKQNLGLAIAGVGVFFMPRVPVII